MTRYKLKMLSATLLSLLMIIAGLFFTLSSVINDDQFFFRTYERLDNAKYMGLTTDNLVAATMKMIHYMEGTADSIDITVTINGEQIEMFNDRERAHMVDVRELYLNIQTVMFVFVAAYACLLVIWFIKRAFSLARAFLYAGGFFLAFILIIGAWVALDFNSFWTAFHLLFFSNDLWLLDPATSRMINMMPEELFSSIVVAFVLRFVAIWGALSAAAFVYIRRDSRKGGQS